MSCRKVVRRVFGNERPEVTTGCRKLRKDDFRSIVYKLPKKMHSNICDVLYSLNSHYHVSAAIAFIFRVKLLLQEYESTNEFGCVAVTP